MTEQSESMPDAPKRLNPFAFPSETDQRFVLFISAAVMWVLNWAGLIGETLTVDVLGEQMTPGAVLLWKLALPAAVILVAVFVYLTHPARTVRQQKLAPFDPAQDASFQREVEQLTVLAGLKTPPRIMLRPGKRLDGQAFGLPNAYSVRLDEVMRLALRKAPQEFRAVVLHELAHIANRDIGRTYFAQALWSATLWVVIAPFLAVLVVFLLIGSRIELAAQRSLTFGDLSRLVAVSLPTFGLLPLMFGVGIFMAYSLRASLLRVRETEADWRAANWGAGKTLVRMFQRSAVTQQAQADIRARFTRLLTMHPTAQVRLEALYSPEQTFRLKLEIPLFVGWLTTTILLGASQLIPESTPASVVVPLVGTVALFIFLGLAVIGALGLGILRESVLDLYRGERGLARYVWLLAPALLLVLGLYLGLATSPLGFSVLANIKVGLTLAPNLLSIQFPLAVVVMWSCLAGLRLFGGRLLGAHAGGTSPTAQRHLLMIGFGGFYALFLLWFLMGLIAALGATTNLTSDNAILNEVVQGNAFVVAFIAVIGVSSGWAVTAAWRRLQPPRCPDCHIIAKQCHVLGAQCDACHAELAPWLFIESPRR